VFIFQEKKRLAGEAKYNFFSLSALAIDGITSFSVKPLRLITILGFICFFLALFMGGYSIISYFYLKNVPGWASLFISIYFLGGIQLLSIGILGNISEKFTKKQNNALSFILKKKRIEFIGKVKKMNVMLNLFQHRIGER